MRWRSWQRAGRTCASCSWATVRRAGARGSESGPIAHFAGYRQGADLADHYAAADIFAFASQTETLGNVVLEAMSSGLPVVALRAGGVGETVDPGRPESSWNPEEPAERFAAAILWLIDQPDERRRMAEAARSLRDQPELGGDHGVAATALPERHRRTSRSVE